MQDLGTDLGRDDGEAVPAGPILGQGGDGPAAAGADRLVQADLTGLQRLREGVPLLLEPGLLLQRLLPLRLELLPTRGDLVPGRLQRLGLLFQPILETTDLVQQGEGLLLVRLPGGPDHVQLVGDRRLLTDVPDLCQAVLQLLHPVPLLVAGHLHAPLLQAHLPGRLLHLGEALLQPLHSLLDVVDGVVETLEFA